VGEDEVLVDPVPLRGSESGLVDLAGADDVGLRPARDVVPVDIEGVREAVVAADLLQRLERAADLVRVEQAGVGDGVLVGAQDGVRRGLHAGVRRVRHVGALAQEVRGPRRLDVPLDVRRLAGDLVRLHLDLLDEQRVRAADDEAGREHQAEPGPGQRPAGADDGAEEQQPADDGDEHEDLQRRQLRVDVGVRRAGDLAARREREAVRVEVVRVRLQQHEQPEQHGEVRPGRGQDAVAAGLQPDAAVEVVGRGGQDDGEEQRAEQEPDHHALERIREREVRDVLVELRVLDPEVDAVPPLEPGLPAPGRCDPGEQPDERREGRDRATDERRQRPAVAVEVALLQRVGEAVRPEAVRDGEVAADGGRHEQAEDSEQQQPGPQHGVEDPGEADLGEPEPVGPEPGEHDEQPAENEQRQRGRDEEAPAARYRWSSHGWNVRPVCDKGQVTCAASARQLQPSPYGGRPSFATTSSVRARPSWPKQSGRGQCGGPKRCTARQPSRPRTASTTPAERATPRTRPSRSAGGVGAAPSGAATRAAAYGWSTPITASTA
jgi:hypothetical protein